MSIPFTLMEFAKLYGTDKLDHGYIPYYEIHLPKKVDKLLEIGVFKGASANMWNDYFPAPSEIHVMDLFMEFPRVKNELASQGIICYQGDQSNYDDLYKIEPMFDVIIEDGSHRSDHQQITFKHLFFNNLRSGGVYVCEDLHCCKESFYWAGGIERFEDTFLYVLQNWDKKNGIPNNQFFDSHQKSIFDRVIKNVKVFDDKIAFIWKK